MNSTDKLPKLAARFFQWYCNPDRFEELHGDLEELFYQRIEQSGITTARLLYWFDVIRCCQPYAWRRRENKASAFVLYKSYFTVAARGLIKHPLNSNVFGLSVSIGICILVYGFFQWDNDIDRFHQNAGKIFLVTWLSDQGDRRQQFGNSPLPIGEMLREDFAHIRKACRIADKSIVVKYNENVFQENVRCVDPEFLEMLTFPLAVGNAESLRDPSTIILSDKMSTKYFADENPIGRDLLLKFSEKEGKVFKVGGVAAPFPRAHDIEFDFLINFENISVADRMYKPGDWTKMLGATFIQVDDEKNAGDIQAAMEKYKQFQNAAQRDHVVQSFKLEQLRTLHQRSANIRDAITYNDNEQGKIGLVVIACLMLALACFNYINIAIVSATRRLKEIGVRKVIGATRSRMVVQFLSENMILTFFALTFGFVLAVTIFIPWFEHFSGGEMLFEVYQWNLVVFLTILLLLTGILSGLYPALYISRFDAVKIFRGTVRFGKKNPVTQVFLGVQMVLSVVLVTTGIVFTQNNIYQSQLSWGYDQKNSLFAALPDSASYQKLNSLMERESAVESTAGAANHIGRSTESVIVHISPSAELEADQFSVGADYFETMALQLQQGRLFRDHAESEKKVIVVNQLLANSLDRKNVVGSFIELDSSRYEIVGILKDFHTKNLFHNIRPTLFRLAAESDFRYLTIKVKPGTEKMSRLLLQSVWAKLFPETPFQGGFQEDVWGIYFLRVNRSQEFSIIIASIAIILAGLGLFGLIAINVSGRIKEFSIRKTLGARTMDIMSVVARQYFLLVTVSLILGVPASYLFSRASLKMIFAYPMPMGFSGIIIAALILIVIFFSVVATQISSVINTSPTEGLKVE